MSGKGRKEIICNCMKIYYVKTRFGFFCTIKKIAVSTTESRLCNFLKVKLAPGTMECFQISVL